MFISSVFYLNLRFKINNLAYISILNNLRYSIILIIIIILNNMFYFTYIAQKLITCFIIEILYLNIL